MKIKQRISIFSQQNPLKPLISIIKKKEIVKKFEKFTPSVTNRRI